MTAQMSARLLVATAGVAACMPTVATESLSRYTSLTATACTTPPPDIAREYAARDLHVEECPAAPPYRLFIVSSDARSWVDVRRSDVTWSTEQRIVYAKDISALGNFPNVGGAGVAEWRTNASGEPVALIVRLKLVDATRDASAGATISRLLVIGLAPDAVCDLGLAANNDEARRLADAAAGTCAVPLPRIIRGK